MPGLFIPQRGRAPDSVSTIQSFNSIGSEYQSSSPTAFASNNWTAVGVAVFVPFWVQEPIIATKMWWSNGAAVAGNIDVGIYDESGNALVTAGNTAQAGISLDQTVDITDTLLGRGTYYMAMSSDTSGATQKVNASPTGALAQAAWGFLEATSANPLPNPVTFARYTRAFYPVFGIRFKTAIGP